jgi:hypothetical protein
VAKRSEKKPARSGEVESFLADLQHPLKPEILQLRDIILGAAPGIAESIKWNVPSFSTSDYFATFHLRAEDSVHVVLHLGVKARPDAKVKHGVKDPGSLLQWRSADRAIVTFHNRDDVEKRRDAFSQIVKQWVKFV